MLLVGAIVLAIFVLPPAWGLVAIVAAMVIEIAAHPCLEGRLRRSPQVRATDARPRP